MNEININPYGTITRTEFYDATIEWRKMFLGYRMAHSFAMYDVIDRILQENEPIKGIVEIGTGSGPLSIFLGLECYERNLFPLLTFDVKNIKVPNLFKLLKVRFVNDDCFSKDSLKMIKEYLYSPTLFICDGGNKKKEFNLFAPMLPKGSVIMAHDWTHEICYNDIKDTVKMLNLTPIKEEEWCTPPDYILASFWKV